MVTNWVDGDDEEEEEELLFPLEKDVEALLLLLPLFVVACKAEADNADEPKPEVDDAVNEAVPGRIIVFATEFAKAVAAEAVKGRRIGVPMVFTAVYLSFANLRRASAACSFTLRKSNERTE